MEQAELFGETEMPEKNENAQADLSFLFELSVEAYYAAVFARMSGLLSRGEIDRYIGKVASAGDRASADRAAFDRGDPDTLAVLGAASKVQHEIHRMAGLLRFNPGTDGVYTAKCAPDYCILPALAGHFTQRFGDTAWRIIDEKRGICLAREKGEEAKLLPVSALEKQPVKERGDSWEELWRLYHRSINNESRKNPAIQRQFMPERYHKYLPEMK